MNVARNAFRTLATALAGVYASLGALWIFHSDRFVASLSHEITELTYFHTVKGLGYVLLSTLLVYALIRYAQRQTLHERQRLDAALAALHSSEERLRFALQGSNDGLWDWDLDSGRVYYSPAWLAMLGFAPDERAAHIETWKNLIHPDDLARFDDAVDALVAGRQDRSEVELRLRHKDGRYRDVLSRVFAVAAPAGGCRRLVGTTVDITERNAVARALREAQRVARIGSYDYDIPADRWTSSEALDEIFGIDARYERSSAGWGQLVHPSVREDTLAYLSDCIARRQRFDRKYPILRASDGAERWVHGLGEITYDESGRPLRMVGTIQDITEQKLAADALQATEARWQFAVEGTDLGLWDWDVQTGRVFYSPRWKTMLGYGIEEIGSTFEEWAQRVHPEDFEMVMGEIRCHMAGECEFYQSEHRLRAKDGAYRWILDRGKIVERTLDGQPARMIGTHLDITERKLMEAALRDSERELKLAQAVSRTGSWKLDLTTNELKWSDETYRLFGLPIGSPVNLALFLSLVHSDDRSLVQSAWEAALRSAADGHAEYGVEHRILVNGEVRWVCERADLLPEPGALARYVLGTVQDITEMREARLALQTHRDQLEALVAARTAQLEAAESQLRSILECSADGICEVDAEGRFKFVNPAACAMLGYTPEALIGHDIHQITCHSHADGTPFPRASCPIVHTLREGTPARSDQEVFWRADGRPIPVEFATQPMYQQGRIVGAVISFADISARREAEAAREAALAEAHRLAQVKSEFLANMSHEIRTPLNAVLGLAQVGFRENVGRRARDTFAHILDSGQLLLGIVNDVLDFSKIESGKLDLEHVRLVIGEVVDRAVAVTAARAFAKGLTFTVQEAPDLPTSCMGDPLRLSQVLVNLFSNAVKFTERGEVRLAVERSGDELVFRVTDTGIGMTEAQIARLFTPFEQADGSTTRRYGGSGLGLAICKRLTDLMGGTIRVESHFGHGTAFEVRVPLIAGECVAVEPGFRTLSVAGLPAAEQAALRASLAGFGVGTRVVDADAVWRELVTEGPRHRDPLLIAREALRDPQAIRAVLAAAQRGERVFVACQPGAVDALAEPLRDRVRVVERPLRVRHLLAAGSATEQPVASGPRLAGIRVLAAEDNEINRLVLAELLEIEGAHVVCVEDGRMALERLAKDGADAFDVVLTDIQMPVMDGYTTARRIREMASRLPVIGLTAHAMPEERARCLEAGMVEHVAKPIDLTTLVNAILAHVPRTVDRPTVEVPATRDAPADLGSLIDWAALEAGFAGRPEFLDKLAEAVLESQSGTPARLREAAAQRDFDLLRALAHSVKGMSGNLKAQAVAEEARRCEQGARAGEEASLHAAGRVASMLDALLAELAARRSSIAELA